MAIMESSKQLKETALYDTVRGAHVSATPEEQVRQAWLHILIEEKGFPKQLILVEKELSQLPHLQGKQQTLPERRIDLLCMAPSLQSEMPFFPLMLVECKQGKLTASALRQVAGYNDYVGACFVGLANAEEFRLGFFDVSQKAYRFISRLPAYKELIGYIRNGFPIGS